MMGEFRVRETGMIAKSSFGQWLKQRRKALDFTQEALARQIGCTVSALYKFEADERRPSRQIAELLAEHLNVPADQRAAFVRFARTEAIDSAAPWGTPFHPSTNLLPQPTLLIGREDDTAALCKRLLQPETHLLTLLGPPGIGKTRLALEAAARLLDDFADGVFFVALAPIRDAALVPTTIATTLGIPDAGPRTPLEWLKASLRDKHMLLVLDNFEQILLAAPPIAELLSACNWLKILVTSRAPLRIRQERQMPVSPLALPDVSHGLDTETIRRSAAVTLFMERAQAVKPDFALTEDSAPTVAALCARLDGLPLAIELISARVKLLPPAALLERLHGRLLLQSDGLRDIEPRHRTLNNAIDWSYQLLSAEEQTLFRRLGVFVGGWALEAVEAICTENLSMNVLDGLASLLDKNLIKQAAGADGEPRFMLLETIREYTLERLAASGEQETLQRQHVLYFLAFAATPISMLREQYGQWLDRLALEHANFRAALIWSQTEASGETGLRLALRLSDFWRLRGHVREGVRWFSELLARSDQRASFLPSTPSYSTLRATALDTLGILYQWQGDLEAAQPRLEESVALFRELGDKAGLADALSSYGMLFVLRGDLERAAPLLDESLMLWRELGNRGGITQSLFFLGNVAYLQGDGRRAKALWEESLIGKRAAGETWMIANLLANLAMVALDQSDDRQAETQLTESLILLRQMGEKWQIVHTLEVFARLAAEQGQQSDNRQGLLLRSARLFGAAEALRERLDTQVMEFQRYSHERGITALRAQFDERTLALEWAAGRAMTLDQAVACALNQMA